MTEKDIIRILSMWVDNRKYPFQIPNAFIYAWECDYWTMDSEGTCREFEIKVSRADFVKDAKKEKHTKADGANYFYYVCPHGLIKSDEIDKRYGLIYIGADESLLIIKKPRQMHGGRFCNWKLLANKMYWRWYQLWTEKFRSKEITRSEWLDGFNIELECAEPNIISESLNKENE